MTSAPDTDREEERDRVEVSLAQIGVSSLAAMSAAIVCSFFGVAGTLIGAAIASAVATTGGALYSYSLRRTRARLRRLHRAGAASPPVREVLRTMREQGRRAFGQSQWKVMALGTGCVFVFAIGVISAIELTEGQSLASLFGVPGGGDRHSSLSSIFDAGPTRPKHSPKPSKSPKPSPSPTMTPSGAATPSPTQSPSRSPSPSPSPSRSCGLLGLVCHSASPTPSGSPTPSP